MQVVVCAARKPLITVKIFCTRPEISLDLKVILLYLQSVISRAKRSTVPHVSRF